MQCLPNEIVSSSPNPVIKTRLAPSSGMKEKIADREKRLILNGLRHTDGNRKEAARFLGMPRSTLYKKMKKYCIEA